MKSFQQVFIGLGIALASILITLGALAITMAEGNHSAPIEAPLPTETPVIIYTTNTPLPSATISITPLASTPTMSYSPSPTPCQPPSGWLSYIIQQGDTLESLAEESMVSPETLISANCLADPSLLPGGILYLPVLPTPTPALSKTLIPCGRPRYWVTYTVMPGDTLYRLSRSYGITVQQLQQANCMGSKTLIRIGQILFVPPWAPITPTPTFYIWPTDTSIPWSTEPWTEPTPTPEGPPTLTPTDTEIPTVAP